MKREYLSTSALKAFNRSPNHYIQYVNREFKQSKAMAFGTAVHVAILEPDELYKRYSIAPEVDRRTKLGKSEYAEWEAQLEGREVISQADHDRLVLIRDAVHRDARASEILQEQIAAEQTRMRPVNGVPYKGIADLVGVDWVADLKTTQDASKSAFTRTAANLFYHLQAAAYRELWRVDKFFWICVETEAPYNVAVYSQGERAHDIARNKLLQLIEAWKRWDGTPGTYATDIEELDLPPWA